MRTECDIGLGVYNMHGEMRAKQTIETSILGNEDTCVGLTRLKCLQTVLLISRRFMG